MNQPLGFGKHKGRYITQVDDGYLCWMRRSFPDSSLWQVVAADTLTARWKTTQPEDVYSLLADFKSCSTRRDLRRGRGIHERAVQSGHGSNMYVVTALIKMYAKCGSMVDAHSVFDSIQTPNAVAWTALLLGYAQNGKGHISLQLFSKMKADGCAPDSWTYVAAVRACASLAVNGYKAQALEAGSKMHLEIGDSMNPYVQRALIDMYAKCGTMLSAHRLFDSIQRPDVVAWNALILGYAENGEEQKSLELFSKMKADGYAPDSVTFLAVLKACISLAVNGDGRQGLESGREIHLGIGDHLNLYVQTTLIDMYAKCGSMLEARRVFDGISSPNVVSWTVLLLGYAENGEEYVALNLFSKMKADGFVSDSKSYVAVLKACTSLLVNGHGSERAYGLETGRKIHLEIADRLDLHLQNTLIDMYAKSGSLVEAHLVFDGIRKPDLVSWNALLSGYADNGKGQVALDLFSKMKALGCVPDSVTYVASLKACSSLAMTGDATRGLQLGSEIHLEIGSHLNSYVQSTLIDMYSKCGTMPEARRVFDTIPKPDVVSWTALVLGYAENRKGHVALDLFSKMSVSNCTPNSVTYAAALKACGSMGALALGRSFHSEIREFTLHVVTCLVDCYAKCGSMTDAHQVFDQHTKARDVSTWNSLLSGYSSCGDTGAVFHLFQAMQDTGVRVDSVTCLCLLLCCSHAGLVQKARQCLEEMPVQHGLTPTVVHYNCMVDVLGRANELDEAVLLLRSMPCDPNAVTWRALLSGCRKWKNRGTGRLAFECLAEMDKKDSSAYVLMAHIYGSWGMWQEQEDVLRSRTTREQQQADEMGNAVQWEKTQSPDCVKSIRSGRAAEKRHLRNGLSY